MLKCPPPHLVISIFISSYLSSSASHLFLICASHILLICASHLVKPWFPRVRLHIDDIHTVGAQSGHDQPGLYKILAHYNEEGHHQFYHQTHQGGASASLIFTCFDHGKHRRGSYCKHSSQCGEPGLALDEPNIFG